MVEGSCGCCAATGDACSCVEAPAAALCDDCKQTIASISLMKRALERHTGAPDAPRFSNMSGFMLTCRWNRRSLEAVKVENLLYPTPADFEDRVWQDTCTSHPRDEMPSNAAGGSHEPHGRRGRSLDKPRRPRTKVEPSNLHIA